MDRESNRKREFQASEYGRKPGESESSGKESQPRYHDTTNMKESRSRSRSRERSRSPPRYRSPSHKESRRSWYDNPFTERMSEREFSSRTRHETASTSDYARQQEAQSSEARMLSSIMQATRATVIAPALTPIKILSIEALNKAREEVAVQRTHGGRPTVDALFPQLICPSISATISLSTVPHRAEVWTEWPVEEIIEVLAQSLRAPTGTSVTKLPTFERLRFRFLYNPKIQHESVFVWARELASIIVAVPGWSQFTDAKWVRKNLEQDVKEKDMTEEMRTLREQSMSMTRTLVSTLRECAKRGDDWTQSFVRWLLQDNATIKCVTDLTKRMILVSQQLEKWIQDREQMPDASGKYQSGKHGGDKPHYRRDGERHEQRDNPRSEKAGEGGHDKGKEDKKRGPKDAVTPTCRRCGYQHAAACMFVDKNHPDVNKSESEWKDSVIGKAYKDAGWSHLSWKREMQNNQLVYVGDKHGVSKRPEGRLAINKKCVARISEIAAITSSAKRDPCIRARITKNENSTNACVLLDTGAVDGNYVSRELAEELKAAGHESYAGDEEWVCGCFNECRETEGTLDLCITMLQEGRPVHEVQCLTKILDFKKSFNLVIGKQTISEHNLLQFLDKNSTGEMNESKIPTVNTGGVKGTSELQPQSTLAPMNEAGNMYSEPSSKETIMEAKDVTYGPHVKWVNQAKGYVLEPTPHERNLAKDVTFAPSMKEVKQAEGYILEPTPDEIDEGGRNCTTPPRRTSHYQRHPLPISKLTERFQKSKLTKAQLNVLVNKNELLTIESDGEDESDESEDHQSEIPDHTVTRESNEAILNKIQMEGTEEFKAKLRQLCLEYIDVLSTEVRSEPAAVTPMLLRVDTDMWRSRRNRQQVRVQTEAKNEEINKQIDAMLRLGVIEPSVAEFYSQVHLTPKPGGKWRFTIDFRNLNLTSKSEGWPLPNIQQMLDRLGSKRAKYWAVFDLTAGYHQAPFTDSRPFTAFITHRGLFQWKRVAMGLKAAGSYFQQRMAHEALRDAIYKILEVYLDDIITFGQTEEELLGNIRTIFELLRVYKITGNPAKLRLGMTEVEYVGHLINEHGKHFTRAKLSKILEWVHPTTHRQMKAFLGLANYFRDHVRNFATLARPLHQLTISYNAKKRIEWNEEAEQAFEELREAIDQCPVLAWITKGGETILCTDACNYGIGGYLYQIIGGEERPIAFISKALTEQQVQKWSTIEKEGYAIYYGLQKLQYLLRDTHFTIKTDHLNLAWKFLNNETNPRVKRWKLAIQEFDFDIEYLEGEANVAADSLSRMPSTECGVLNTDGTNRKRQRDD